MFHIFHKWEITKKGSPVDEFDGMIRKCSICGKRQRLEIHILGYNPYAFVRTWIELKRRKT